jgi:AcrR family transcriptional regulator
MAKGTRERIMDVALVLFAEQGVAATPVTAIEAAAGLSAGSGSFYRHFKDKAELLSAVVQRELTRVKKVPVDPVGPNGLRTPFANQLLGDLRFLGELRHLIAILMWERGRSPEVAALVQEMMVERGVEMGVADLLLKEPIQAVRDDPAAAANVMMFAMVGYFLNVEYFGTLPGSVDPERYVTTLARLLTESA